MLTGGTTEPCTGPWSAPIVPIKKPDGSTTLCVDYRCLNTLTMPNPFCMPLVYDIIDQTGKAQFLSKIYLSRGFYEVPINADDLDKMALLLIG